MVNIQFDGKNHNSNFIPAAEQSAPAVSPVASAPQKSRWPVVSTVSGAVVLLLIVFAAARLWQKNYLTRNQAELAAVATVASPSATSSTIVVKAIGRPETDSSTLATASTQPIAPVAAEDLKAVSQEPLVPTTTKGGQVAGAATVKPVVKKTTTSQPKTTTKVVIKTVTKTVSKPGTPVLDKCGDYDGTNFNVSLVLPKFTNATEYSVQIGTSSGSNNIYDHQFEQTERVVFQHSLKNDTEYYVRYQVKLNGDWSEWSNTLKFKCSRS